MNKLQEKAVTLKLGLYLHVPFCARSCDFCHFYQEEPRRADLEAYLEGMEEALARAVLPAPLETVFWGGGTPGLLPARDLARLGEGVLRANGGRGPREWTVEMAPATVKADKLRVLRDLGVNRISVGVQSFDEGLLGALGRIHSREQVRRAIDLLQEAEIPSFNLDLIFAIPGQSLEQWECDLKTAVASGADHLSTYCLTFEEDTALWLRLQRGEVKRNGPDEEARYFETAWAILGEHGFGQYEVSNFARPGSACEHNLNTWRMQDWLGLGPSASSQFGGRRWTEPHSLKAWLAGLNGAGSGRLDEGVLTPELLAEDLLIFGLRMNEGVDPEAIGKRCPGALPAEWPEFENQLLEEGLARRSGSRLMLTDAGRLVADRIGAAILEMD